MTKDPRSHGPKHMFRRAQSMANESGKPAYVVYNHADRSYYAQTEYDPENDSDDSWSDLVAVVEPKKRKMR